MKQLRIHNLDELAIIGKDQTFNKLFKVISLLGVGAFGVVLEVKNKVTHEISALKVNIANHLLNRSDYQSGKLAAL